VENILYSILLSAGKGIDLLEENIEKVKSCRIRGSHSGVYGFSLQGYNTVYSVENQLRFQEGHVASIFRVKQKKQSKEPALSSASYWFPTWLIFRQWRWRRHVLPNHLLIFKELRAWCYIPEDWTIPKNTQFKIRKILIFLRFTLAWNSVSHTERVQRLRLFMKTV
jgi:hypothetical protein